ncbi:hypothetical protein ABZ863_26735 [Saccharomonospora sp. NPDC046836]|uniref:hypothetical protein n=1 Tax=Saccharomonospora sp. NPDC046836 TaxID=3156921 RepID=UPI0033E42EE7
MSDPRAEGPALVWAGEPDAPVLFVLDPLSEGKHGEIPPTWAELTGDRRVAWCRLPVEGARTEVEELLSDPDVLGSPIDLLASGRITIDALDMAARHAGTIRSVLIVDPDGDDGDRLHARTAELGEAGVTVTVVARSVPGDRDRIGPPLPLGHPDVVAAVHRAVTELDAAARGGV